ncbi:hypothetical protein COCMIDRAFT_99493 [Bipolaris oryzae ATCC 44560]|uniref:Uncharacterized protein n=1 Tax=Bipolaris oryzae ATCC 44560 TaxID=930090 RepID=W6Z1V2_COCMI|nr:uncharacterized protein COCMIDRAFT_99493 [Bipolaris oryzae ATCC 44560]EUC43955.1 hypothetical protein COCMIDRAFT_99493 [Bipolaris oryzae ATCC 44560]
MGYTIEQPTRNAKRVHFSDGYTAGSATPVDDFLFKRANCSNTSNAQEPCGTQASVTQSKSLTKAGAPGVPTPPAQTRAPRLLKKSVEQGRRDKEATDTASLPPAPPPPPPPSPPRRESQFLSSNLPASAKARLRIPKDLFVSPNIPESIRQLERLLSSRSDLAISSNLPTSLPSIEVPPPPPGAAFPNRRFPQLPNQAGAPGVANSVEGEAREYITLAPFRPEAASSSHNLPPLSATVGDLLPRRHVSNTRPNLPKLPTPERASSVASQSAGPVTRSRALRAASEPAPMRGGRGRGRGRGRPRKIPSPSPLRNETIFPLPAQPIEPRVNISVPIPSLSLPKLSVQARASRIFAELFNRDSHTEDVTSAPDERRDPEGDIVERPVTADQPLPSPPTTSSLPPPATPPPPPRDAPIYISSGSSSFSSPPSSPNPPPPTTAPSGPTISISPSSSSSSSPSPSPSPTTRALAAFASTRHSSSHIPSSTVAQPTLSFPRFPRLTPRSLPLFHTGAVIAVENILEDYAITPDFTLLDLVDDLQENRPKIYDWEHVTIMRGGNWVYGVLRRVCAEWGEDVGVEEVGGRLMEWVEGEFERLGGG